MRMLHNRFLVFVLWVCASIFVHFCFTCALIHPLEKTSPPNFALDQDIASVEAHLVSMPANTQSSPQEETLEIIHNQTAPSSETLNTVSLKKKR